VSNADDIVVLWDGKSLSHIVFEANRQRKHLAVYAIEVTTVVNRNREPFDTYIGRGTPWGNPFRVGTQEGEFTREEAVHLFRNHFHEKLLSDPLMHQKTLGLRGDRLGCSCKPLACHGDVIVDYLNSLDPENLPSIRIKDSNAEGGTLVKQDLPEVPERPTHLFISYAVEDVELAKWLARKLAGHGYAVWLDQLKLLGGEPWPQSIDHAIKHRTFRMLALMSVSSVHKQNPSKERALAIAIGRRRNVDDFLITLKVDNVSLDWLTNDISYISFSPSWADGLRNLLRKLSSIGAPKTISDPALVSQTVSQGEELLSSKEETLRANVVQVSRIPIALRAYQSSERIDEVALARLQNGWAFYKVRSDYFVAFDAPPSEGGLPRLESTSEEWVWRETPRIHGTVTRNIVANLVLRSLDVRLRAAGLLVHPDQRGIYYVPAQFTQDGLLRFSDVSGRRTWVKIKGSATFVSPGKPRERNSHHFAFRLLLGRGLDQHLWIEIVPTVFFFDNNGQPIVDKRVGSRRRRLTRNWWNNKWLSRLLATESLLLSLESPSASISLENGLLRLNSSTSLIEAALEEVEPDAFDGDEVILEGSSFVENQEEEQEPQNAHSN
jgi:hypothetical protein